MTAATPDDQAAEIWASTWISSPCPVDGFGSESGYSVAWVQVTDGPRLQALVAGNEALAPGTPGRVRSHDVGDESIDVFTAGWGTSV